MLPVFPVAGDAVTCGLRLDVPRINRRHLWAPMGMETRNLGDKGFYDVPTVACVRCGRDDKGSSSDASAVDRNVTYVATMGDLTSHVRAHKTCTIFCDTLNAMAKAIP